MKNESRRHQGIAISIFVGIGVFFILPLVLAPVLRQPAWLYLPIFMACYFLIALVLGFIWSPVSWQVGLVAFPSVASRTSIRGVSQR